MNLLKNVAGSWEKSRQLLRQDLDAIQRAVNQLLEQNQPTPTEPGGRYGEGGVCAYQIKDPAATISSANTVTTYKGDGLISVATAPAGALSGAGTGARPLAVKVDGSTITVNTDNELAAASAGVSVAAAGALDGDGTSGDPLLVKVDGSTISINGSNELVAAAGENGILLASGTFSTTQVATMNSVPVTMVSGVASRVIVPLAVWSYYLMEHGNFSNAVDPFLRYAGVGTNLLAMGRIGYNTGGDTSVHQYNIQYMGASALNATAADPFTGTSIVAWDSSDQTWTPWGGVDPAVYTCTWTVAYFLV